MTIRLQKMMRGNLARSLLSPQFNPITISHHLVRKRIRSHIEAKHGNRFGFLCIPLPNEFSTVIEHGLGSYRHHIIIDDLEGIGILGRVVLIVGSQ